MSVEVRVPVLGESVVEATVGAWLKHEGDAVEAGESLVQLETEKVNVDVAADQTGVLGKIAHQEGETVHPGDVLALLDDAAALAAAPRPVADATVASPAAAASDAATGEATRSASELDRPHASPVARRLAEEHGLDLSKVEGSGTGGRVTREDVERHLGAPSPGERPAAAQEPAPAADARGANPERRETKVRMSRRRQTIAQRLVEAQRTAAMLTTFNEADMSAIMAIRARHREAFQQRHGVSLGYMSFFTKAVVAALQAFPNVNAEIRGDEIIQKQYYDIGIAVGSAGGLVVPVVRDADRKSFADLEREIGELAEKVRGNTLTLDDLRGGTFSITNGGVYGSLLSTPILSLPQVGILGMHKIEQRPIAVDGQVVIRPMMYLALTYDHRIVDGSEAVQFLVRIKQLLEDPTSLLLE
ncbi:MAG: 2-oxoglutarate dehydrogenase complex dihydrolipoyllysine-residue succinyltransferase [Chloroflexi bacterium]|nr:2-oxoglutarate dehydrogenase complex dihydrolipoyllysine-residue succinyltransferase [Chloroflexota bacterium]